MHMSSTCKFKMDFRFGRWVALVERIMGGLSGFILGFHKAAAVFPRLILSRFLLIASLMFSPMAAYAECLGQGCYSGLGTLALIAVVVMLVFAALVIWIVVRLVRHVAAARQAKADTET